MNREAGWEHWCLVRQRWVWTRILLQVPRKGTQQTPSKCWVYLDEAGSPGSHYHSEHTDDARGPIPRPFLPRGVCKVLFLSGTSNLGIGYMGTQIPRNSLGPFNEICFLFGGQLRQLVAWEVGRGEVNICAYVWIRLSGLSWAGPTGMVDLRGTLSIYSKSMIPGLFSSFKGRTLVCYCMKHISIISAIILISIVTISIAVTSGHALAGPLQSWSHFKKQFYYDIICYN
jgi:hypothetical protein